jgi:hypothetical protein
MADSKLLSFIASESAKGTPESEIRTKATAQGWSETDVNGAMAVVKLSNNPLAMGIQDELARDIGQVPHSSLGLWIGIVVVLIAVGAGVTLYSPYLKKLPDFLFPSNQEATTTSDGSDRYVAQNPITEDLSKILYKAKPGSGGSGSSGSTPAPSPTPTPVPTPTPTPTPSPTPAVPVNSNTPSVSLTADNTNITAGGQVTLTWTSSQMSSCQGEGFVANGLIAGSITLPLTKTTVFGITCSGSKASITKSISINVTGGVPPVIIEPPPTPTPTPTPSPSPSPTPTPPPPTASGGYRVYSGCQAPSTSYAHSFYVDPVNGKDTNDGSQANPWKTLNTVLSSKIGITGGVQPGDVIYLMATGNHGNISLSSKKNTNFITVTSAPGQLAQISTLSISSSAKWVFTGLKIQSLKNSYNPAVNINTYAGPTVNDIIIDRNYISSIDNSNSWSSTDWTNNALYKGISLDRAAGEHTSGCIALTNNKLWNIYTGIVVGIDRTLVYANTVDNFAGDGIDFSANSVQLTNNLVTNARAIDANHPDAFQGQLGRDTAYSDIDIEDNTVYRQTNPSLAFPNILQGISAFDADWTNVTIKNNVVITAAWNCIAWGSIHNAVIENNTVISDQWGNTSTNLPAYSPSSYMDCRIAVSPTTHQGPASTNVTVRNNIVQTMLVQTTAATVTNNVAVNTDLINPATGKVVFNSTPGTDANGNITFTAANYAASFAQYSPSNLRFDAHLTGSPASGHGASVASAGSPLAIATTPASAQSTRHNTLAAVLEGFKQLLKLLLNPLGFVSK